MRSMRLMLRLWSLVFILIRERMLRWDEVTIHDEHGGVGSKIPEYKRI